MLAVQLVGAIEQVLHRPWQNTDHLLRHLLVEIVELALDDLQLLGVIAARVVVQVSQLRVKRHSKEREKLARALLAYDANDQVGPFLQDHVLNFRRQTVLVEVCLCVTWLGYGVGDGDNLAAGVSNHDLLGQAHLSRIVEDVKGFGQHATRRVIVVGRVVVCGSGFRTRLDSDGHLSHEFGFHLGELFLHEDKEFVLV